MNQQPDRTEDAYRAALGVMVEDTPPAPEWEDLLPTQPIRSRPAFTPRRGWAVALVAAGIVLILVGGIAISVITFGSNEDVIEQPPPTTTPTSVPDGVLDDRITAPAYADVPSFTGTVQYYEHDPSLGDPGWQATVEISHAGPLQYQATVIAEEGDPFLGGPGRVFLGDGTGVWVIHSEGMPPEPIGDIDNFRYLYFDSERPSPPWDEICEQGAQHMGSEEWLGRTVAHVACSTTMEDYELWVDEEAGLVLKMAGPLTIGDYHASIARDGFFEFTELTFNPVTISDPPVVPAADLGEYPPFHMVRLTTRSGGTDTDEIWYLDENTARETVTDSSIAERIGTFELTADGYASNCYPGEGLCERRDISQDPTDRPIIWQIPLALVEENCTESGDDTVAGRPARHFACEGVHFVYNGFGGYWTKETDGGTTEHWFDAATELHVKAQLDDSWAVEATLLEVDPVFPAGIFDYVAMDFPDLALQVGEVAPVWHGPLLAGGEFDLADYRRPSGESGGSFVVVLDWLPWQCEFCVDGLIEFQSLYDKYGQTDRETTTGGSNVEFVMVSETQAGETTHALDRLREQGYGPLELPIVAAAFDGIDPDTGTNLAIYPDSPWWLWYEVADPLPSFTVLDPFGTVIAIHRGDPSEYIAELDQLLADVIGGS